MVHIKKDVLTSKAPFTVLILDAFDKYYYADFYNGGENETFAKADNIDLAKSLANALFITKNFMWKSLKEMNELDAGYDVRVYDSDNACVYAAHTHFQEKWIEGANGLAYAYWQVGDK